MNKLLGYCEINVSEGVVPVKIGCYTLERFCESYGIGLTEIGDVFESRVVNHNGSDQVVFVPKEPAKFLSLVLFHGATYAAKLTNSPKQYILENAYEWIDEIGLVSEQSMNVAAQFISAIRNGGTPVKASDSDKKKEESL